MHYFSSIDIFEFLPPVPIEGAGEAGADTPLLLTIPLLPEGKWDHPKYGKLDWSQGKFMEMARNFENRAVGYIPCLNFDHASENPFASTSPAAGWFTSLTPRAGGLDAVIELTPRGREAIRNREYRYISAEVADSYTDSQGLSFANVIVGAALTNTPFHDTMRGLFGRKAPQAACFSRTGPHSFWAAVTTEETKAMSLLEKLRKHFSLPETADEAAVTAALEAEEAAAEADVETEATAPASVSAAVPAVSTANGVVVAAADTATLSRADIEALKAAAGKVATLETQIVTLTASMKTSDESRRAAEEALAAKAAQDLVEGYVKAGKILPAQRETALQFAKLDATLFKSTYDAAAPQIDLAQRGHTDALLNEQPDSYEAAIGQALLKHKDLDYVEAARIVAEEQPGLYEQYRQAQMGRRAS